MKCHYCGAETSYIFCHNCGTRQQPASEQPKPEPIAAAEKEEAEFAWKPFEDGELIHEPPAIPNYYFFDEEKEKEEEPGTAVAVAEAPAAPVPAEPAAVCPVTAVSPRIQLPTGRGLLKMFFLSFLTLGIYPVVIWSRMASELNITASRYDGERTMPWLGMLLVSPLTLGIYVFVWHHGFCRRLGAELARRNIPYRFGAGDFWLWNILGSLILVGPFIFLHKLTKSMNLVNGDFNVNG